MSTHRKHLAASVAGEFWWLVRDRTENPPRLARLSHSTIRAV